MPIVNPSSYKCPVWLRNPHAATIIPSLVRKVRKPDYVRERIKTPDNDFLDLDWLQNEAKSLIIISHGLEGSSDRTYVRGLAEYANTGGFDVLAWNCRGCSGEMNKLPRFYHHGDSNDLASVVEHVNSNHKYDHIFLVGYSMGGSMTTKYLGEGRTLPDNVKAGIAVSTPFDLLGGAKKLDGPGMGFYRRRFLGKLKRKIELKQRTWPALFDPDSFNEIKSFRQFDTRYTAPLHGFTDADDFYTKASAGQHLVGIEVPFLILNAEDDPFLTENCFPFEIAQSKNNLHLEVPKKGGHVGFMTATGKPTWSETRSLDFIKSLIYN